MSTIETSQRIAPKRPARLAGVLVAVGALIAVAVAGLFIFAFAGKSTTTSARSATGDQPTYQPLIQYRGTGQAPTAPTTHPAPGAPRTTGLLRAEHSYGAVP